MSFGRLVRVAACAAFALGATFGVATPVTSDAAEPHVLRFTEELDVTSLNPLLTTVAVTTDLSELTMAHFVRIDASNRLYPELLTVVPTASNGGVSRDGKTITFHLRRGVRWSDGAPFDASDVLFTVKTILDPKNNISVRDAWDRLAGVDAPDAYTVRFHLKAPYGGFASRYFASDDTSCVLPKHLLDHLATINDAPYNGLPVGIGPFRYTAFRRGDRIEMEANPYYFRGRPKLDRIVYKIITDESTVMTQLQTGELDLWGLVGGTFYDRVRALPDTNVTVVPGQYVGGIYLNTSRPALADPAVRRALMLDVDRTFVLTKINHGAGFLTQSVMPQISRDYVRLPYAAYDPGAAARLLDANGWKIGSDGIREKGGTRLAVQIALPSGYQPSQITAEFVRAAWQKLGVAVDTKAYSDAQYFAPAAEHGTLNSGEFDAALLSQQGAYDADLSARYACAYAPPNGNNIVRFCDPKIDAEMAAYEATVDPAKRASLAAQIQRDLDRATPSISLYERAFIYASGRAVRGFHPGGFTAYDDFMNVDVDPAAR